MSLPPRRTPATPATNRTPATTRKTPAKAPAQPLKTQPLKTPAQTGPAPNVLRSSTSAGASTSNVTPPKGYGYVPSYIPPRPDPPSLEEVVQAFQDNLHLSTDVEIPEVMQVTTMEDLVQRILTNASTLYPGTAALKVTTAVAPNGMLCHALLVAPKNPDRDTSRYKVVLKGPGVPGERNQPTKGRRSAVAALLEELERAIGKEFLGL